MTSGATVSIPCVVITGALGSGKTTVIRDLMERPGMEGTALIINEFGEVGLDHLLVSSAVETTLLMENGCLCCSLRGDLVDTVMALLGQVERGEIPAFDRLIIETTGLADPLPIIRDLSTASVLEGKVHLSGVTTCVDGVLGLSELSGNDVAIAQVAQADICLLTKSDLTEPLVLDQLREKILRINPLAFVMPIKAGHLPDPGIVFDTSSLLGQRVSAAKQHDHKHSSVPDLHSHDTGHDHHGLSGKHVHSGVESWSILLDRPLPWAVFKDWLDLVYSLKAAQMLRMKGLLWVEELDVPLLVQGVGPVITPLMKQPTWANDRPQTRLVLIAKNLSAAAIESSFQEHILKRCKV
jgi:G3E family GTPase